MMTITEIRKAAEEAGSFFFSADTMRFFKSRVHLTTYDGIFGTFFVTSEMFPNGQRRFTVRLWDGFHVTTIGGDGLGGFGTSARAHASAKWAAKNVWVQ